MIDIQLGVKTYPPIRSVFETEDRHFTPWLSENIGELSSIVGVELECIDTEHYVGKFRSDVLCKDIDTDQRVIIENQLFESDMDHLGKLLTYSAGVNASHAIWVATSFTTEHKNAIEHLNNTSDSDRNFFAVEVGLMQIDDSLPTVIFSIAAAPNEWVQKIENGRKSNTYYPETLADLVRNNYITASQDIFIMDDRGSKTTAIINTDGKIELNNEQYEKPSTASRIVLGRSSNGWTAWQIVINGKIVTLDDVRKAYRENSPV